MSQDIKYNIICLSNQLWDFPYWTNKRHVMSRLSKQGHNVIFVDPPITLGILLVRKLFRGDLKPWDFFRVRKDQASGTKVYTPFYCTPFLYLMAKFYARIVNRLAAKNFDANRKTILWVYHVQLKGLKEYLTTLNYDILVYDCVDNYEGFPIREDFLSTVVSTKKFIDQEKYLAQNADVIFASAPGLVTKLKKYAHNVYFTPNVGDYERFKNVSNFKDQIPDDLASIPRPRVGYIGAMDDYKFDYALVQKAARENPSFHFVLIGAMAIKDKAFSEKDTDLSQLPNIHILGTRPYELKEKYMAGFDVDMIPYQLNDYTVGGCFPVKFHDSLAAGLPVVVTDLPAYLPFADVCYISKNAQDFSTNLKKALDEDSPDKRKQRQQVAKENNWDGKVAKMLDYINAIS